MSGAGMGCKRQPKEIEHRYRKCKNIVREHPAKTSCSEGSMQKCGPHIAWGTHKKKMALKNNHCEEMAECINIRDAVGTNIGCYYKCKECAFECATRAVCIAHAHREHTDKLIGPCKYCGSFYAHYADMMKHHVNECAGSTKGSDDNDD